MYMMAARTLGAIEPSVEIKEIINNTPTISPKKGYWRNYKDEHTCSICNEVTIQDPSAWIVDAYLYCPWCGAELSNMEVDANGE